MPNDVVSQLSQFVPIILIFVVFIVLIIVPQKKREKKIKNMLSAVKVGDNIKTIGGFYGKVTQVKEDLLIMECGPDKVKLQLAKGAIAAVESSEVENEISDKQIETK